MTLLSKKRAVVAVSCGVFLLSGIATAAGRSVTGTVGFLQVWGTSATTRLALTGSPQLCDSPAGGAGNNIGEFAVGVGGVTSEGARAMLATITAAKLAGRSIKIYANDGAQGGYGCAIFAIDLN